ncbi:hypothetical protein HK105_202928 [Polyrhizophydium stewartii]|uniref:Response regulatory domain-containing protein n=1 Tax=Polyrhizophydium stewartii TaxID=2732419 RepID=A0ABR4NDV7_9FUNG
MATARAPPWVPRGVVQAHGCCLVLAPSDPPPPGSAAARTRLPVRLASANAEALLGVAAQDLVGRDFADALLPPADHARFLTAATAGGCHPLTPRCLPQLLPCSVLVHPPSLAARAGQRGPAPCVLALHWTAQHDALWLVVEIELAAAAQPPPPSMQQAVPAPATFTIKQSDPTLGPLPRDAPAPGSSGDAFLFPTLASGFHRSPGRLMNFLARLDHALAMQHTYLRLIAFCCRFLRLFTLFSRVNFVKIDENLVSMFERIDLDPIDGSKFTVPKHGKRVDFDPDDWSDEFQNGNIARTWADVAMSGSKLVGDDQLADFDVKRCVFSMLAQDSMAAFYQSMNTRSVVVLNIPAMKGFRGVFSIQSLAPRSVDLASLAVLQSIAITINDHIGIALMHERTGYALARSPPTRTIPSSLRALDRFGDKSHSVISLDAVHTETGASAAAGTAAISAGKADMGQSSALGIPAGAGQTSMAFLVCLMSDLVPVLDADAGIISTRSASRMLLWRRDAHAGIPTSHPISGVAQTSESQPDDLKHTRSHLSAILACLRLARFASVFATHRVNVDLSPARIASLAAGHELSADARRLLDAHRDAFEEFPGLLLVPLSRDGSAFIAFLRARKILRLADEQLLEQPEPEAWRKDIHHHRNCLTRRPRLLWTRIPPVLTPLHALINTAEAAMEEAAKRSDPAGLLDKLQTVRDTSVSLVPLMHDLLHLLQSRSGQLVFRREPFSVADAVRRASRMLLASVYTTGDTTLDLSISDDLADVMLIGDASKLRQIVWNQCAAVMPVVHGKTTLHLSVGVEDRTAEALTLVLRASSSGTSKRSMEASRRAANETLRATGLSFHVMSQLVAARRGTIWDEPHELRVSMHFEIQPAPRPAALIAPAADAEAAPAVSAAEVQAPAGSSSTGERAESEQASVAPRQTRILVAEDNPVNRQVLCRRLRAHLVSEAHDGSACVSMFAAAALDGGAGGDACDLILMDVQMPECDGIEATRQIRALEAAHGLARTPIIGVSANVSVADWTRCREAGMDGFVPKPTNFKLIEAMIAEIRRGCIREFPPADNITQSHTAPGWFDPATTTAVFAPPTILQ